MSFDFNAVMLYSKGLVVIYCVWFPVTLLASTRGYPWMLAATWSSTRPTSSWIWGSLRKLMSCWPFARRLCCLGESCLGMSRLHWLCALRACTFLSDHSLDYTLWKNSKMWAFRRDVGSPDLPRSGSWLSRMVADWCKLWCFLWLACRALQWSPQDFKG